MPEADTTVQAQAGTDGGTVPTVDYVAELKRKDETIAALTKERDEHANRGKTLVDKRRAEQIAAYLGDLADPEYSALPSVQGALEWDDDGGLTDKARKAIADLRATKPGLFRAASTTPAPQTVAADPLLPASRTTGKMSETDWRLLYKKDPVKAMQLLNDKMVEVK